MENINKAERRYEAFLDDILRIFYNNQDAFGLRCLKVRKELNFNADKSEDWYLWQCLNYLVKLGYLEHRGNENANMLLTHKRFSISIQGRFFILRGGFSKDKSQKKIATIVNKSIIAITIISSISIILLIYRGNEIQKQSNETDIILKDLIEYVLEK